MVSGASVDYTAVAPAPVVVIGAPAGYTATAGTVARVSGDSVDYTATEPSGVFYSTFMSDGSRLVPVRELLSGEVDDQDPPEFGLGPFGTGTYGR